MNLGIVIPSYNEADNIARLITELLNQSPHSKICVVDDSPSDATEKAVLALALPPVSCIHRAQKGGRGSAVLEGLRNLRDQGCDVFVEMDADFSHSPLELPGHLADFRSRELDLLIASRYLPASQIINWPLTRRIFSACANFLTRRCLGVPVHDYTNGYRFYSKRAAEKILATCGKLGKGFISLSEILVNVYYSGFRVGERPTVFKNRVRGESSVTRGEITNALRGLYQITLLTQQLKKDVARSDIKLVEPGSI